MDMEQLESSATGTRLLEEPSSTKKKRKRGDFPSTDAAAAAATTISSDKDDQLQQQPEDDVDRGHRYGNFRNYYTFHPVENRTRLLGEMMDHIASQWSGSVSSCKVNSVFYYTDIGCNEGDLTVSVAKMLHDRLLSKHQLLLPTSSSTCKDDESPNVSKETANTNGSSTATTNALDREESNANKTPVPQKHRDDVTTIAPSAPQCGGGGGGGDGSPSRPLMMQVTGLDLDPILVQRACDKSQQQDAGPENALPCTIQYNFRQVDVLRQGIPNDNNDTVVAIHGSSTVHNADAALATTTSAAHTAATHCQPGHADLTTLFSTTMWIHIHGGDDGLRRVLQQMCATTRMFVVVECLSWWNVSRPSAMERRPHACVDWVVIRSTCRSSD